MKMITKVYYNLSELVNKDAYIINLPGTLALGVEDYVGILLDENIPASDSISKELMSHIWANISYKNVLCLEVKHPR